MKSSSDEDSDDIEAKESDILSNLIHASNKEEISRNGEKYAEKRFLLNLLLSSPLKPEYIEKRNREILEQLEQEQEIEVASEIYR